MIKAGLTGKQVVIVGLVLLLVGLGAVAVRSVYVVTSPQLVYEETERSAAQRSRLDPSVSVGSINSGDSGCRPCQIVHETRYGYFTKRKIEFVQSPCS